MPRLSMGLSLFERNRVSPGSGGGAASTNCWNPLEILTDGWYGYDSVQASPGNLEPEYTADGTFIYAFKFDESTGEFILQIGVAGNEQLENTAQVIIKATAYGNLELQWDEAKLYYTDVNLLLANDLVDQKLGQEVCFEAVAIPQLLVHYSFSEVVNG